MTLKPASRPTCVDPLFVFGRVEQDSEHKEETSVREPDAGVEPVDPVTRVREGDVTHRAVGHDGRDKDVRPERPRVRARVRPRHRLAVVEALAMVEHDRALYGRHHINWFSLGFTVMLVASSLCTGDGVQGFGTLGVEKGAELLVEKDKLSVNCVRFFVKHPRAMLAAAAVFHQGGEGPDGRPAKEGVLGPAEGTPVRPIAANVAAKVDIIHVRARKVVEQRALETVVARVLVADPARVRDLGL